MKNRSLLLCIILIWVIIAAGCAEDSSDSDDENLEIIGSYSDNWGSTHEITANKWTNSASWGASAYAIDNFSNSSDFLIAQNDVANDYNPEKWSRFDWTTDASDDLYYCQSATDKDTAAEAEAVNTADSTDPANGGCGDSGFSWTQLIDDDDLEIIGSYSDNWGSTHEITANKWSDSSSWGASAYAIDNFENSSNYLVAQNDAANDYNAKKWSRFDWTTDASDDLYYCQIAYDKDTAAEAEAEGTADSSDPANNGCGSSSWTKLTEN